VLGVAAFGQAYPASSGWSSLGPTIGYVVLGPVSMMGSRLGPVSIAPASPRGLVVALSSTRLGAVSIEEIDG